MPDVVARLNEFNAAHPWSHNDFYHRWLLRQLPPRRADLTCLDVGCGTGNLARRLAPHIRSVHGIDIDPASIATARKRAAELPNVSFDVGGLDSIAGRRFDVITALAVIHHLPLEPTLTALRALLSPGGRLLIVGCYAEATTTDRAVAMAAVPANLAMGVVKSRGVSAARVAMSAPTLPPEQTLADVHAAASRLLPGARIRRRLFWRYTLAYAAH